MAHYAILDENNIVVNVFPGHDENDQVDWEVFYSEFHNKVVKRTSINTSNNKHSQGKTPFRINYASIGMRYDPALDGFIYPQPFTSWVLDVENGYYIPPVAMPDDGKPYRWDEPSLTWIAIE
jgi:hypothetical protein